MRQLQVEVVEFCQLSFDEARCFGVVFGKVAAETKIMAERLTINRNMIYKISKEFS